MTDRARAMNPLMMGLFALLVLGGCDYSEAPQAAPLHLLASDPETYQDTLVVTTGVVRTFAEPRHYWVEDKDLNRVEIRPMERVADHVGERVSVTGTFHFAANKGRWIDAETVTLAP
ncbi:hypothetical protein [Alloalcanivorax mobilis]|uniref:hypothetical protein n=1 Tax=Alloalcanivorax mobilis TaxID=2019569 RepID=UPI0012FFDD81|nr:hypothetical protein [Alloalcanivorax mobilis]